MIVWAVETLLATTLLMLLVLVLRTPVRRVFGPGVAYALWALPAGRMLLPPLPETWRAASLPAMPVPEDITIYLGTPVATLPAAPASGPGWPAVALGLWLAGAVAFIGYHLIAHRRFCARVQRTAREADVMAAGNVRVIQTDATTGPLAFGVIRKFVAFPCDFTERYDPLERDLALAHELGHHARGDLIANWFALALLAIHWFNPVAWRAFRAFRADQEMACDALVLAGRARELRAAYGRAIVKSAHGGAVSAACHLHTINEIKGRLKMLTKHETTSSRRRLTGSAAISTLLLAGLGLTASGTHATETVRERVESATGVDLAELKLPSLPQAEPLPPPPAPPLPPKPVAGQAGEQVDRSVTTTTDAAGKTSRKMHIIVRDKDGKVSQFSEDGSGAAGTMPHSSFFYRSKDGQVTRWKDSPTVSIPPEVAERLKNMKIDLDKMPQVSSRICAEGEGGSANVIRRGDGDKSVTIICTNRIQSMASLGALDAARIAPNAFLIRRDAQSSALSGLRSARRSIELNRDMGDKQRKGALAGIDQAIRELEAKQD